jgi:hypothetical protein
MALTHTSNETIRHGVDAVELMDRKDVDGRRDALKKVFVNGMHGNMNPAIGTLKDLGDLVRDNWVNKRERQLKKEGRLKIFILPLSDYDSERKDYSRRILRSYVRVHYPAIRTRLDHEYLHPPDDIAGDATALTEEEEKQDREEAQARVQFDVEHDKALSEGRHLRLGTYAFTGMVSSLAGVIFALVFNPVI